MNELRINPENVSHIKIYDAQKGVRNYYNTLFYTWKPKKCFMFLWLFPCDPLPEGYWRNGEQDSWSSRIVDLGDKYYDFNGELWSFPCIDIFSGETKIETKRFKTVEECKEYCDENFKGANVII